MENILKHWNLTHMTVTPIVAARVSTWDIGGEFVLKQHEGTEEIDRSLMLSMLLAAEGIPVVTYHPTTEGMMTFYDGQHYYSLMTKLPGSRLDLYEQPDLASEMGRALSRLHIALARIEPKITACSDNDLVAEWHNYIKPGLDGMIPMEQVMRIEALLCELYPKLPRQIIHRDAHMGNVLFDNGQVSGWFDFDISRKDVRLFDLIYLLSYLMPTHLTPHTPERVAIWRSLCDDIIAGYQSIQPLTSVEHDALPMLMMVDGLLFVSFLGYRKEFEKQKATLMGVEWLFGEYEW